MTAPSLGNKSHRLSPGSQPCPSNADSTADSVELGAFSSKPLMILAGNYESDTLPLHERAPRFQSRTPSPTPSEQRELRSGIFNWRTVLSRRFWFRREWLWYYVALIVICVIFALVTLYHKQIVHWLTPVTRWLHDLKYGWLVPIAILFIISFPPLFGHEIVAILCGLVWGLWVGFGIVCAGTFLGEVGNFYAFKWCCRARAEKLEKTKLSYACLAKVVRDGGFVIALIARLSAIPGHFTTAVFSACGMGIIVFSFAAVLSLPKQLITVYLGVILEQSDDGTTDSRSKLISDFVLGVTFLITLVAMWYILRKMNKAKVDVIYERRKARQANGSRNDALFKNDIASRTSDTLNSYPIYVPLGYPASVPYTESSFGTSHFLAPHPRKIPDSSDQIYDMSSVED